MFVSRRQFVRVVPTLGAFTVSATGATGQEADGWPGAPPADGAPRDESFPSQHPFRAKETVGVSHGNLARVKELISRQPSLAKASWDWGFGDWETALGAASHVGNRPIAEFLLQHGAPPTIFSATMLGQLDVVKAFAASMPDIHLLEGPHGIPLLSHARAGGPAAVPVLEFLQSLGPQPSGDRAPLSDNDRSTIEGRYAFGSRPRDAFLVDTNEGQLGITRVGASRRNIVHRGNLEFRPAGARSVRIVFERAGTEVTLTVLDPDIVVTAQKG